MVFGMCELMMMRFHSRKMVATTQNYFMVKWGKRHVQLCGKKAFCVHTIFGYLGKGSVWLYLGLTLNLSSYNFLKPYHQSDVPLIFVKIKIYSIDTLKFH